MSPGLVRLPKSGEKEHEFQERFSLEIPSGRTGLSF